MAYIIDETYFQRNLIVPNAQELNSGAYSELQTYIDSMSRLCLKDVLNRQNFSELDSHIVDGNLSNDAPQKWKDLVNGVEYTVNNETFLWEGLIKKEGAFNKSLLANFVYYHWLYDNQSKMSGVGEVVVNAKNSINVNSTQRLTNVWNEFVEMYQGKMFNYQTNTYFKRGVRVIDYLGCNDDNEYVSLMQFLIDNEDSYPDASLKRYKFKNQLGL